MKPYFQTTPFTTAASALVSILHYVNPHFSPEKENEFQIWHNTVNLPTRGSSIYALALYAQEQGVQPTVVVEKPEYSFPDYRFYRYTKEDVEHATFSEETYRRKAENAGITIHTKQITLTDIKKVLDNNILLLRLNTKPIRNQKRNTSNYIVVTGYADGYYHIIDPAFAALSIPELTMQEAFESLGNKKYRDHRMIMFSKGDKN